MAAHSLTKLLKNLPPVAVPSMILSGLGVWIIWGRKANETYYQTLHRFGGLKIAENAQQGLLFFHDAQLFPALARLQIWAQIHPEPATIQILPVKLILGESFKELSLSVPSPLDEQKIDPGHSFDVWIHPGLASHISAFPGLTTREQPHPFGMTPLNWLLFQAESTFSQDAELEWFFFVKPMMDKGNANSIQHWKQLYLNLKSIMEHLGIRYIYQEGLLFFKIEGMTNLAAWCRELLQTIARAKTEDRQAYWPCLFQAVNSKGQTLTDELPNKVTLHWDRLPPDTPHIPLSAALLLRKEFDIDILHAPGAAPLETPCQVSLAQSNDLPETQSLIFPASLALSSGKSVPCYYCGLRNHALAECPSRQLFNWDPGVWNKMAVENLKDMAQAVKTLDSLLANVNMAGIPDLLQAEAPENIHIRAVFEINAPVQHRMLRLVWRSTGKEFPDGIRQLSAQEGEYIWAALENLRSGDPAHAEKMMHQALMRTTKNYQPHILLGFIALEGGNPRQSENHWTEAQRLCYTPLQNSYLFFLKARLKEVQGHLNQAHDLYLEAQAASPKWLEPRYRQGVCMVKKGFLDQAWSIFSGLIADDPHIFNRLLIDTELERGRPFLLASLASPWHSSRLAAEKQQSDLGKMSKMLKIWFDPTDEFYRNINERIEQARTKMMADNYVAFSWSINLVKSMQKEFDGKIKESIADMKIKVRSDIERLRMIRNEIAGFPFPRFIRRITSDTNKCARLLHSISVTDLNLGDKFRRASMDQREAETILQRLHGNLRSIRIMRDGLLFFLFLGKNFLWLATLGLIASIIVVPVFLHSLQQSNATWALELITSQRWQVQRAVSIIMVIVSASIATVWTSLRFEKQKQKYLEKAKSKKGSSG